MKDRRTAMEKLIDKFWDDSITKKEKKEEKVMSVSEIDHIIHHFIHTLLLKAEDD